MAGTRALDMAGSSCVPCHRCVAVKVHWQSSNCTGGMHSLSNECTTYGTCTHDDDYMMITSSSGMATAGRALGMAGGAIGGLGLTSTRQQLELELGTSEGGHWDWCIKAYQFTRGCGCMNAAVPVTASFVHLAQAFIIITCSGERTGSPRLRALLGGGGGGGNGHPPVHPPASVAPPPRGGRPK
jgi:hypothetical protein